MGARTDEASTERERLVTALAAAEQLRRVVRAAGGGPRLMPLKGVLLQWRVYRTPQERVLSDVDLLAAPGQFEDVARALAAAGFVTRHEEPGSRERSLAAPGGGPLVDLHRELFMAGQFRLDAAQVFARGTVDEALFGVPVVLPAGLDVFAHLVGHAATTWLRSGKVHLPGDFAQTARAYGLEAEACARHLRACGLDRAARYVLRLAGPSPFGTAVLAALGRDPVGELLARAVLRGIALLPRNTRLGQAPASLLHRTPRAVARTIGRAVWKRISR